MTTIVWKPRLNCRPHCPVCPFDLSQTVHQRPPSVPCPNGHQMLPPPQQQARRPISLNLTVILGRRRSAHPRVPISQQMKRTKWTRRNGKLKRWKALFFLNLFCLRIWFESLIQRRRVSPRASQPRQQAVRRKSLRQSSAQSMQRTKTILRLG